MKVVVVCGEEKPRAETNALIRKLHSGNNNAGRKIEYMSVGLDGKDCKADYRNANWIDRCFPGTTTAPFADVIVLEGCPARHVGRWEGSVFQHRVLEPLVRRVLEPFGALLVLPSPLNFLGSSPIYSTTLVHKNGRRTELFDPNDKAKYVAFFENMGLEHVGEMRKASVFMKV